MRILRKTSLRKQATNCPCGYWKQHCLDRNTPRHGKTFKNCTRTVDRTAIGISSSLRHRLCNAHIIVILTGHDKAALTKARGNQNIPGLCENFFQRRHCEPLLPGSEMHSRLANVKKISCDILRKHMWTSKKRNNKTTSPKHMEHPLKNLQNSLESHPEISDYLLQIYS